MVLELPFTGVFRPFSNDNVLLFFRELMVAVHGNTLAF
jgi:hypothetical protein